ncbi:SEC-C domain-containing protein [Nocardiopsis sp. CT-R113]|uniref:SEC-C domain-containing protein n=1 Tax=Nocardiopsis codii TaxID=3065942 RepID=A0ABU7K6R5_9ACTN|nr:SEC-C domain-containing protein [Nocardiopsis sp. CT-R113]MEE2037933.1 SEC-C domain-containing protein [Nocardiopsis sp. CT-R113]
MTDSAPPSPLPPELVGALFELDLPQRYLDDLAAAPDEAGEILLNTAQELGSTSPQAARDLLEVLRSLAPHPDHRQYATHMLAESLRAEGRTGEAERLITELMRPGVLGRATAVVLADEFAGEGDLDKALYCYNVACRAILAQPAQIISQLDPYGLLPLVGRAAVREGLGLAPDDHDRAALAADGASPSLESALGLGDGDAPGRAVAVHAAFSRDSLPRARDLGLATGDGGEADHHHGVERSLRAESHPGALLATVLTTPEELVAFAEADGLDAADPASLRSWAETLSPDSGRLNPWPPERNHPCWCGSGRKYKKCCGSPSVR